MHDADAAGGWVDLYWIPLGAGAHFVRLNGKIYEALTATVQRRPRYDILHSALIVALDHARFTVEMTPAGYEAGSGPSATRSDGGPTASSRI